MSHIIFLYLFRLLLQLLPLKEHLEVNTTKKEISLAMVTTMKLIQVPTLRTRCPFQKKSTVTKRARLAGIKIKEANHLDPLVTNPQDLLLCLSDPNERNDNPRGLVLFIGYLNILKS